MNKYKKSQPINDFIMKIYLLILTFFLIPFFALNTSGQNNDSNINLTGTIQSDGENIPFASIYIKGTTLGTVSDASGHYEFSNIPEGEIILGVKAMGYKSFEKKLLAQANQYNEMSFELKKDVLQVHEVVVTADRSEQKRTEAPVIVNTISGQLLSNTQSPTLGDALSFSPGLRFENNCQNCGFTQVRMNGLEGPYSQILINSRPIFSGLAGVYGLELIPANMIEKIEVVRGGGSALYGSNAIAGTINVILREPKVNSYEAGGSLFVNGFGNQSGNTATDRVLTFNTSLVSKNHRSGISLYGYNRDRGMYDANDDGFSELAPMKNISFGTRMNHSFGKRSKITADFFAINEERAGGNMHEYPLHEREVAEAVEHDLTNAAITFDQYFRDYDKLSVYASGQLINRASYYGSGFSLQDYGNSDDKTYNIGGQYKMQLNRGSLIAGVENTGSFLVDKKLGYHDYENAVIAGDSIVSVPQTGHTLVADQSSITSGFFAQYDVSINKLKITLGGRYDHYEITDLAKEGSASKTGNVLSPRISFMFDIIESLQARASYAQGYRAPQIFDEDLHIETSTLRQVINVNDPALKQETSHSYLASLDYNGLIGTTYTGFLVEGFYTRLEDPFVNEIGEPNEAGEVEYLRKNAEDGATVKGINMEFKLRPLKNFTLNSGFTIQTSRFDEPQEFNERNFIRAPEKYGFFMLDWDILENTCIIASGTYTGSMLVHYFGPGNPDGEMRTSTDFFDAGIKIKQTLKLKETRFQLFMGIKNILNAYQSDFDTGPERDPAYMYGPVTPRTIYAGIKIGNLLK